MTPPLTPTTTRAELDAGAERAPLRTVVIEASKGWSGLRLGELWGYRDLVVLLAWRDIKVRYAQTVLGVAWAVLQPLLTMVVFSVFFGRLAKLPSDGAPYPLFAFAGLLPWQLFSQALAQISQSLVTNQHLLTKVYFPRLVVPLAAMAMALADFAVALLMMAGLMAVYGRAPTAALLALPLLVLLAVLAALAVGIWLAALNVRFRDVRYTVPFLLQIWMYISPVAYSSELVPEKYRVFYALNPMVGVIDGFRWAVLGTAPGSMSILPVTVGVVLVLLVTGLFYFKRAESTFADTL
jgi:lipopolysaccharide transport system permease protein